MGDFLTLVQQHLPVKLVVFNRDLGDVGSGIADALTYDGPVLIDAEVSRMGFPVPPGITADMAKGFTLYLLKAIMAGCGDELIDLARTNLWL
jgi:pyruvate dehydrogenase (quinone)